MSWILTDGNDFAFYALDFDDGSRTCYDNSSIRCESWFPPVRIGSLSEASLDSSIEGRLGTFTRRDGSLQLTFNGWPLHYSDQDTSPGDLDMGSLEGWFYPPAVISDVTVGDTATDPTPEPTPGPEPTPEPTPVTVVHTHDLSASSTGSKGNWTALVRIEVRDADGNAAAAVTVNGRWSSGRTATCTTNGSGLCSVQLSGLKKRISSVAFTVTGLSAADGTYDAGADEETSIIVSK